MPTATTSKTVHLQPIREGSRYRSARDRDDVRQQWKQANKDQAQMRDTLQAFDQLTRKVEAMRRRILGGSGGAITGWFFGTKIELPAAPYPAFAAQQLVHIQATHAIVTSGIRDAANPSGSLVKSCVGLWVALQAVPAQKTVSGNPVWNLPQFPYPTPTNLDDITNFWYYLGEMSA